MKPTHYCHIRLILTIGVNMDNFSTLTQRAAVLDHYLIILDYYLAQYLNQLRTNQLQNSRHHQPTAAMHL